MSRRVKTRDGVVFEISVLEREVELEIMTDESLQRSIDVLSPEEATDLARELLSAGFRAKGEDARDFFKTGSAQALVEAEEELELEELADNSPTQPIDVEALWAEAEKTRLKEVRDEKGREEDEGDA